MRFSVLGPVGVVAHGRRVTLARGHQRTILAVLLATEGGFVATDRLVAALWGSEPPPSARKSLQSHVSRLRNYLQALAPGEHLALTGEPDGYRLDLAGHDWDAAEFCCLVERAHGCRDPKETVDLLDEAERRWSGTAFGDLAEHPEVTAAARRLDQRRAAAAADRVDALMALGRYDDALRVLPDMTEADPFDERAYAQLMRALVASGRQAEALATYRDIQQRLRDELGVDPSPDLCRLHEEILRQERSWSSSSEPRSAGRAPGLVSRSERLLGRDRDVEVVSTWVCSASLVTLTGPGGVGKTRLAERIVSQVGERWRDGVISCALAHVRDDEGVGGALITALTIQPSGGQSVAEALVSGLGDRHVLLFLDNCEHVLNALTPYVEAILAGCQGVTVLATSRERLRLPNERVWPVAPLDVPQAGASVAEVEATSSGMLFRLRAEAVDPEFTLHARNVDAVAQLCRGLDGMPLAIELAAARTRALSPAAMVERLDRRFALLAGGPRHEGGRHRTLQAVVAWSYDLLEPSEADLFDRLAVFAGAAPLTAIEQVCSDDEVSHDEIAGLVGELVDKSMVVVHHHGNDVAYRLLDTMRDFGLRRLEQRGMTEALRRSHAAYHVWMAETQGARVCGPEEADAVAVLDRAMDDLRAAHTWALAVGEVDTALRLPGALPDEVTYRLRDEITTWARRALMSAGSGAHPARAAALATAAWGATSRDECVRAAREAETLLNEVDQDDPMVLLALGALGATAVYEGRLDDVLDLADRQVGAAMAAENDYRLAFAWVCRILGHLYRGESREAAAGVSTLHAVAERSGSPTMRAFAHYCDGEVHLDTDPDHAATALQEAVNLASSVGNRLLEGVSLVCLASSQGRRGHVGEALRAFRDVVAHWRRVGDHTHQLTTVRNLVELLAQIRADEPAATLFGAVTAGDTPTYGVEAERLTQAWNTVEARLGPGLARQLAARGEGLGARRAGDEALRQLDMLLDG